MVGFYLEKEKTHKNSYMVTQKHQKSNHHQSMEKVSSTLLAIREMLINFMKYSFLPEMSIKIQCW